MKEKKQRFTKLYKKIILEEKGYMNEDLNSLFDSLLCEEFDNNPELMSEFIQSIVNDNSIEDLSESITIEKEIKDIRKQIKIMQESLLKIANLNFVTKS
ncbi:hypothetical protein [Enterococcus gallinarum]|uniref:hypothetical protein n=1 Tax=Enterococcus gallinarum TaxID=1353 RepID=UPI0012E1E749|nr:hypothetical protein [Enterococcus gallinarum]MUN91286.1 hypothetical protein [Enterococcus gallinarum]